MTDVHDPPTKTAPPIDAIVARYVEIRDQKAALKTQYDKDKATLDAALERIEAHLLKRFQEMGVDSVKTAAGTAYTSTQTSATVADWDQTLDFIRGGDHWAMLEKRVSKGFVEAYKEEHNGDLPPGINWREESVVNVRRT